MIGLLLLKADFLLLTRRLTASDRKQSTALFAIPFVMLFSFNGIFFPRAAAAKKQLSPSALGAPSYVF